MSPFASLFVLAVVLFVAGSMCVRAIHRAPSMEPETSPLDRLDGVAEPTRCWSTGPRGSHAYAGVDGAWECMRCGDRVERPGGAA